MGVWVLPNGKTLVGGTANPANNSTRNLALARLNTNGSLDTTFDLDGKILTDLPGTSSETVSDMEIQSDGKIILAGGEGGNLFTILARYNVTETLTLLSVAAVSYS